jgi:hypothetical protein
MLTRGCAASISMVQVRRSRGQQVGDPVLAPDDAVLAF